MTGLCNIESLQEGIHGPNSVKETFERILSLKDDLNDQWRNLMEEAKPPNLGIFSKLDLSKLEPDLNDFEEFEL